MSGVSYLGLFTRTRIIQQWSPLFFKKKLVLLTTKWSIIGYCVQSSTTCYSNPLYGRGFGFKESLIKLVESGPSTGTMRPRLAFPWRLCFPWRVLSMSAVVYCNMCNTAPLWVILLPPTPPFALFSSPPPHPCKWPWWEAIHLTPSATTMK